MISMQIPGNVERKNVLLGLWLCGNTVVRCCSKLLTTFWNLMTGTFTSRLDKPCSYIRFWLGEFPIWMLFLQHPSGLCCTKDEPYVEEFGTDAMCEADSFTHGCGPVGISGCEFWNKVFTCTFHLYICHVFSKTYVMIVIPYVVPFSNPSSLFTEVLRYLLLLAFLGLGWEVAIFHRPGGFFWGSW